MNQEKIWDFFQNEDLTHHAFPEARQRFMLKYLKPGMVVLNIGVGSGALERMAFKNGVDIHALDPSRRTIERLRNELQLGDKAQAGYAQNIPFDGTRFDAIVMSEVLEHLETDALQAALRNVFRSLKPGGFLLASTPYKENLKDSMAVCPQCGNSFHKVGHVQSFDKVRMERILHDHNFVIDELRTTTFVDWQRKGIKNFCKSLIRVLLARMGEQIADPHLIVIARKPLVYGR